MIDWDYKPSKFSFEKKAASTLLKLSNDSIFQNYDYISRDHISYTPPLKKSIPSNVKAEKKVNPNKECQCCGKTQTPLWREVDVEFEGKIYKVMMCNACGLRYRRKKVLPPLLFLGE